MLLEKLRPVALLLLTSLLFLSSQVFATAQVSTPTASPDLEFPKIAIIPIGDFEDGYIRDMAVRPGESLSLTVSVDNFGSVPADVRAYKVNANTGVNGGFLAGEETEAPVGATAWLDFPSIEMHLEPGQRHEITFNVVVPKDVAPGQYMTGLMVRTADAIAIPGSEMLDQIIGYVMSISFVVEGELTSAFELEQGEVLERTLQIPITNTGNYLVRPAGELTLTNSNGDVVLSAPIQMAAVYAGTSTVVYLGLPDQIPPGDYILNLELTDTESVASDAIEDDVLTVPEAEDPTAVTVVGAEVQPNADEIIFANVDVTLNNGGQQIPASNVTLEVIRDGEQVDSFPLATNQVLLNGENQFVTRYLPADMWQSGEYTFSIKVSAVDPNGGQETILLDEELDATIVVP